MNFRAFIVTCLFVTAFSIALAAEKDTRNPLEALHGDTMGELTLCQMSFKLAQLDPNAQGANYRARITDAQKNTQRSLKRAIATAKPAAVKAIKAYYVAWVAAVKGVEPGTDEVRFTYAARQSAVEQRLDELWAAVEMESAL